MIIAPVWCKQSWYRLLLHSLKETLILLPSTADIILGPKGEQHPPGPTGALAISRVACVRESLGSRGLSDRVVSIVSENAYSSVWRRWSSWCAEREADPISAPINLVFEFLTDLYDEGKQYRTINTARSAISMIHDQVDGLKVGQYPLTDYMR